MLSLVAWSNNTQSLKSHALLKVNSIFVPKIENVGFQVSWNLEIDMIFF